MPPSPPSPSPRTPRRTPVPRPTAAWPVSSSPVATQPDVEVPGGVLTSRSTGAAFEVHLEVFEGPFDLLLGLISKHKLDITEVALARVTDEFIGWIRAYREVN